MAQTTIDAEALRDLLDENQPVTVLDIRRAEDRAEWAIPGSVHVEAYDAPLPELDPLALQPEPERGGLGVGGAGASAGPEGQRVTSQVSNTHSQSHGV